MNNKSQVFRTDSLQRDVIKSFARAVESAYFDYKLDLEDFLQKTLLTDIFKNYREDYTVYSQGAHCIAGKILEELQL